MFDVIFITSDAATVASFHEKLVSPPKTQDFHALTPNCIKQHQAIISVNLYQGSLLNILHSLHEIITNLYRTTIRNEVIAAAQT